MDPVVFGVADGITAIDTFYGGLERYTAAYLLDAREPAIVETGPTTSAEHVKAGLDRLGIGRDDLAHIVVTHIHLDHAGAAGVLARRFPELTIFHGCEVDILPDGRLDFPDHVLERLDIVLASIVWTLAWTLAGPIVDFLRQFRRAGG